MNENKQSNAIELAQKTISNKSVILSKKEFKLVSQHFINEFKKVQDEWFDTFHRTIDLTKEKVSRTLMISTNLDFYVLRLVYSKPENQEDERVRELLNKVNISSLSQLEKVKFLLLLNTECIRNNKLIEVCLKENMIGLLESWDSSYTSDDINCLGILSSVMPNIWNDTKIINAIQNMQYFPSFHKAYNNPFKYALECEIIQEYSKDNNLELNKYPEEKLHLFSVAYDREYLRNFLSPHQLNELIYVLSDLDLRAGLSKALSRLPNKNDFNDIFTLSFNTYKGECYKLVDVEIFRISFAIEDSDLLFVETYMETIDNRVMDFLKIAKKYSNFKSMAENTELLNILLLNDELENTVPEINKNQKVFKF